MDSIKIYDFLVKNYYQNGENLMLNNQAFVSVSELEQTSYLYQLQNETLITQFFEDENILILKCFQISQEIITVLGNNGNNYYVNEVSIDEYISDVFLFEAYINQNYFLIIIDFMLNQALLMNWQMIADINFEPEKAFSEDKFGANEDNMRG